MSNAPATNEHLTDEQFQEVWRRRCAMLNWAGLTYRYHRKRQRFFDVMDKLTQAAAVGGGVAVAGKTLPDNLPLVGGLIAFTGLLALVYGYGDKRQCHKELAEQRGSVSVPRLICVSRPISKRWFPSANGNRPLQMGTRTMLHGLAGSVSCTCIFSDLAPRF